MNAPAAAWILAQYDTALERAVGDAVASATSRPHSFVDVVAKVADVFAPLVVGREPSLAPTFTPKALVALARQHARTKGAGWIPGTSRGQQICSVLQAWLAFAHALLQGMPSPYEEVEPGYWPFGQEGGFCNQLKLRALQEQDA